MGERRAGRGTAFHWLAGCAGLALGAAPLVRAGHAAAGRSRPSSTRRRRSIRCPTLASNGPTSTSPSPPRRPKSKALRRKPRPKRPRRRPSGSRMRRRRAAIAGRSAGIEALADADAIRDRLRRAVGARRRIARQTANAAQIDRRARADAELLAELLRSQGYYDAMVEPRIERGRRTSWRSCSTATPGAQYRFETVELPGLDAAAGERSGEAARGVRGQGRRPGRRAEGHRRRRRAAGRARRAGLRHREGRRAGHRHRP